MKTDHASIARNTRKAYNLVWLAIIKSNLGLSFPGPLVRFIDGTTGETVREHRYVRFPKHLHLVASVHRYANSPTPAYIRFTSVI